MLNLAHLGSILAQPGSTGLYLAQQGSNRAQMGSTEHFREDEFKQQQQQKPFLEAHRSASA